MYSLTEIWVSKFAFLHSKLFFSTGFCRTKHLTGSRRRGAAVCCNLDCKSVNLGLHHVMGVYFVRSEKARGSFLCLFFVKRWLEIHGTYGALYFCARSLSFLGVALSSRKWRASFRNTIQLTTASVACICIAGVFLFVSGKVCLGVR